MAASFYPVRQYMAARGPTFDPDADSPRYKLCLAATDREYLISVLTEAVERPDGYYVKYSTQDKDGMFLGRIFLASNEALGRLWARLKGDDKLLVSVQDDHFTFSYRDPDAVKQAREAGE